MSAKQFGIFKEIFISKYGNSLNWKNWKGLRTIEIKFYRSIVHERCAAMKAVNVAKQEFISDFSTVISMLKLYYREILPAN